MKGRLLFLRCVGCETEFNTLEEALDHEPGPEVQASGDSDCGDYTIWEAK